MKISIITLILFSVIGCGSFKKTKEHSEINKESSIDTNKETKSNEENKTLEPVDPTKPMVIYRDGKTDTIYNTRVIYNTTEKVIKENTKELEKEQKKEEKKEKESDNTLLFLGVFGIAFLFLFLVIIFVIIYFSSQIKKLIPTS